MKHESFVHLTEHSFSAHLTFQVIKAAEDCALQYMNFMNVIFAAQKQVNVDLASVISSVHMFPLFLSGFVFVFSNRTSWSMPVYWTQTQVSFSRYIFTAALQS